MHDKRTHTNVCVHAVLIFWSSTQFDKPTKMLYICVRVSHGWCTPHSRHKCYGYWVSVRSMRSPAQFVERCVGAGHCSAVWENAQITGSGVYDAVETFAWHSTVRTYRSQEPLIASSDCFSRTYKKHHNANEYIIARVYQHWSSTIVIHHHSRHSFASMRYHCHDSGLSKLDEREHRWLASF